MDEIERLKEFQQEIKIEFKQPDLLKAALTHPSWHEGRDEKAHREFERMEFFGDALLNFIIAGQLIQLYPDLDEGHLSKFRSTLVSREALFNVIASKINLHKYVSVGSGEDLKSPREKAKILADITEALLAGIYYDQGLDTAREFVLKYFEEHMTQESIHEIAFNAKGALQEEVQKKAQRLPDYTFERHGNKFICNVSGGAQLGFASGEGLSKKEAAQNAAAALLKKLNPEAGDVPLPTQEQIDVAPVVTTTIQPSDTPAPAIQPSTSSATAPVSQPTPHTRRAYEPRRPGSGPRYRDRRPPYRGPRRSYRSSNATGPSTAPTHPSAPLSTPRQHTEPRHYTARPPQRPHSAPPSQRTPHTAPPPRSSTPYPRRPRTTAPDVDWRSWQTSKQPKSPPSSGDEQEKSTTKSNWRDRIKKLTGQIRKKKKPDAE